MIPAFQDNHSVPKITKCGDLLYKPQKVQKYALNSQLQALQILTNDDEVENWSLSSFLLAVPISFFFYFFFFLGFFSITFCCFYQQNFIS